jgi:hypothetical protein
MLLDNWHVRALLSVARRYELGPSRDVTTEATQLSMHDKLTDLARWVGAERG